MNIRIEGNDIRFKISRVELESLNQGGVLTQSTSIGGHPIFDLNIVPKKLAQEALKLQTEPSTWTLFVDTQTIEEMMSSKPTRGGLNVTQGALSLTLQVDIRR